jgi:thymidine phosphorylase
MNEKAAPRPQLKLRRMNLDTGRENVVVISSRSKALRPPDGPRPDMTQPDT